jgi:ribose transport system ATP-binding protein
MAQFSLRSSEFSDGDTLPKKYTIDGESISPPLSWDNIPEGTKSFALIMTDSDVPPEYGGFFPHWILYDIPASVISLAEGTSPGGTLPAGAKELENAYATFGMPDRGKGYGPPWPAGEHPHRYTFTLYAVKSEKLSIAPDASYDAFSKAILPETIAATTLVGKYGPAETPMGGG